MERFKLIASMYLILIRDNQVLLARRQNTGFEDGKYGLPAGHLEENETLSEGLVREAKEEIDIDIAVKDVTLVHTMHRKSTDTRIDFFFETSSYSGTPINNEPDKCDDVAWFPLDKLPENTIPYIRTAIQNTLAKRFYSEIGWENA